MATKPPRPNEQKMSRAVESARQIQATSDLIYHAIRNRFYNEPKYRHLYNALKDLDKLLAILKEVNAILQALVALGLHIDGTVKLGDLLKLASK